MFQKLFQIFDKHFNYFLTSHTYYLNETFAISLKKKSIFFTYMKLMRFEYVTFLMEDVYITKAIGYPKNES